MEYDTEVYEEKKRKGAYGRKKMETTNYPNDEKQMPEKEEEKTENTLQQVQIAGIKISQKMLKMAGIVLVILAIVIVGARQISSSSAQKRGEKYAESLQETALMMLKGAGDAENCGNLTYKVWRNAIYEEDDSETDIYTKSGGRFVSDFNDALKNLFQTPSFKKQLSEIEENQNTVRAMMKDMKNPPEEYEDAYEALSELYDAYLELTNLVSDPNGSLQTYSNDFTAADSKTANCFSTVEMYFDD